MAKATLNEKQRAFCRLVAQGKPLRQAAKQAGYHAEYGKELMQQEKIKQAVEQLKTQDAGIQHGAAEVLRMYEKMAFCDIKDFVHFGTREVNGKRMGYIELKDDAQVDGQLIEEIVLSSSGVPKIKLYDKEKALEKLERYYDLLPDTWKRSIEEKKLSMANHAKQDVQMQVFSSIPRPEGDDDAAH